MNQNDCPNQPSSGLVFYSNVLSLENLASYRVALNLWRNELVRLHLQQYLPSIDDVVEKFKADNNATIPSRLLNSIAGGLQQIGVQLGNWLCHPYDGLYRERFFKHGETWMKYFDQLAWYADDYTLDYFTTCHNLLQSDRICVQEKFAIACSYCLENRVEDLWRTCISEKPEEVVDVLGYLLPWLVSYWVDRMKNHAAGESISNTFDENDLIHKMPKTRWVIEYFWPYLTPGGQFQVARSLFSSHDARCMKYLSSILNETVLRRILKAIGSDIIEWLILNAELRSLAMPFWKHVAYLFDSRQFFKLVTRFFLTSEAGLLHFVGDYRLCEEKLSLCLQIWACAPKNLKHDALNLLSTSRSAFKKARLGANERYGGKRLVKMILSEASPQQRTRMWRNNWLKLCMHATKSDMNDMIEMCLEDTGERMEFKLGNMMKLANIHSYCFLLLDEFEITKLNDFLIFCSIDPDTSAELKRALLKSYCFKRDCGCSSLYFRRINDFVSLINESFPNPKQNASFKKEFINSKKYLDRFLKCLCHGEFGIIKNLVSAFLSDEQDVREWKQKFKPYCHQCLSTGSIRVFDAAQWQNFMIWCLGSDENVTEFKRSLDVGEVFRLVLEGGDEIRGNVNQPGVFHEFSKWCGHSEDVATFNHKRQRQS